MALSRLAQEFAAEIKNHDWSDAPFRIDRAGHRRELDSPSKLSDPLSAEDAHRVQTNVMWVVAQVLGHADPNFDPVEFARACGITDLTSGEIEAGLRSREGRFCRPGTWEAGQEYLLPARDYAEPAVVGPGPFPA